MSSPRKTQSARANGAKSHGPVTPAGKAASSRNALRHGLTSKQIVLPNEDPAVFDAHLTAYLDHFQPAGPIEIEFVEIMAAARWRLRRLLNIETNLLTYELDDRSDFLDKYVDTDPDIRLAYVFQQLSTNGEGLSLLSRYEATLNRTYERALKQLQLLQSQRAPAPVAEHVAAQPKLRNEPTAHSPQAHRPSSNPPSPPPSHPTAAAKPPQSPNPGALS